MINPNKPFFDTGHIVSIQKMTAMTIIRVWIKGSAFEFASFKYRGRLKVNDHVKCKLRFSIIDDGLVIEKLNRYYTNEEKAYKRMMAKIKASKMTRALIG